MTNRQNKYFISLAIKALGIKRKFQLYTSEKEYAKAGNCSHVNNQNSLENDFSESFNSISHAPEISKPSFFKKLRIEDSVENFVMKSVLGFIGGIFLTYVCFMFLVFSLNFTLKRATYICMGLGVILSLGLAFSVKIRCTVFLCIPQLFSKRGRQALLAYAFILALSGPAKNTLHNVEVMSESLACTQEQLKQAENELLKCVQKPNAAAKKSIEKLLEKINSAVKDFKNFILQLYKNCFDILETVLQTQKWLYSITLLCHKKMGHPGQSCLQLLAEAVQNCQSMYPDEGWRKLCRISPEWQQKICCTEEKSVCPNIDGLLPVFNLQKQLDAFKRRTLNVLYVKIEAQQTYSHANRSHTYHEEYQGMATEIRQKTDQFLQYFDCMSVIFGIFILVLFVKVVIYRHKFLTEDHYDNRYITSDFIDIDNTRAAFHMETILPLEPREKMQYIKVTSVRLVPSERVRLFSSFVFLIFATFKIIIHMLTDSSLYWILSSVRGDERLLYMSTIADEQPVVAVRIVGCGLVASLFENVTRVVRKELSFVRMDPTPCLPDPVPPDWNRYYQILALVIICWLLALWEPYGLRLRHTVMVTYHPDRARERAIWLYNRIISNRISFVKTSRRMLRRKYKNVSPEDTFRYKFLGPATPKCLLCESTSDLVRCTTPNCPGIYCPCCFCVLKFCNICRDPAEYGDFSDISEEKDSSEDECQMKAVSKLWSRSCNRAEGGSGPSEENVAVTFFTNAFSYSKDRFGKTGSQRRFPTSDSSDWDQESLLLDALSFDEKLLSSEEHESVEWFSNVESRKDLCVCGMSSGRLPVCPPTTPHFPSGIDIKPDFNFKKLTRGADSRRCDVGVLARIPSRCADVAAEKSVCDCSLPPVPRVSDAVMTCQETTTSTRFPFVDPTNLHEVLGDSEGSPRFVCKTKLKKKKSWRGRFPFFGRKKKPPESELEKSDGEDQVVYMEAGPTSSESGQFYSGNFPKYYSEGDNDFAPRMEPHKCPHALETDSSRETVAPKRRQKKKKRHCRFLDPKWDRFASSSTSTDEPKTAGRTRKVTSRDTKHELNITVLGTVDSVTSNSDCN